MSDIDQNKLNELQLSIENIDYSKYPILIVDDDVDVLETMTAIFAETFDVSSTSDIDTAIKMLHENNYAVLISDQKMPELSGVGLLAIAKEMAPQTVRILLTGYTDLDSAIDAINEGNIFRYISKNAPTDEKEEHIKEAIEHYLLTKHQNQISS